MEINRPHVEPDTEPLPLSDSPPDTKITFHNEEHHLGDCCALRYEWPVLGLITWPAWRFYLWKSALPPDRPSAGSDAGELLTEAPSWDQRVACWRNGVMIIKPREKINKYITPKTAPKEAQFVELRCPCVQPPPPPPPPPPQKKNISYLT